MGICVPVGPKNGEWITPPAASGALGRGDPQRSDGLQLLRIAPFSSFPAPSTAAARLSGDAIEEPSGEVHKMRTQIVFNLRPGSAMTHQVGIDFGAVLGDEAFDRNGQISRLRGWRAQGKRPTAANRLLRMMPRPWTP